MNPTAISATTHSRQSIKVMDTAQHQQYYRALLKKDSQYDGVVYFGIRTTGIFCRPICTAKKPKFENCEFFESAQAALLAGYRPCKRCRPIFTQGDSRDIVNTLIESVEAEPEKRWTDRDFRDLGIDSVTARRKFKQRFGMTFVAYARARRMGLALGAIRKGEQIVQAQLGVGYQSGSGFRDAFSRILGNSPKEFGGNVLHSDWISTPLGPMLAIASPKGICLLEFTDRRGLEREIERLRSRTKSAILPSKNPLLTMLKKELESYFNNGEHVFKTPLDLIGTDFQIQVWNELRKIPTGQTRSYAQQAMCLGRPGSFRAVARANGANQIAIVVPCHRVIGSDGKLTGYAGGLPRKQWLLDHESSSVKS